MYEFDFSKTISILIFISSLIFICESYLFSLVYYLCVLVSIFYIIRFSYMYTDTLVLFTFETGALKI